MGRPIYAVIIPLGEGEFPGRPPGIWPGGGYPDQGLPGGPEGPAVDPPYPDQGLPGRPPHVGNRPPGSWDRPEYPSQGPVRPGRPIDPGYGWEGRPPHVGNRPPGSYPGRPDQGLPGQPGVWPRPPGGEHPDQGLPPELGLGDIGPSQPWVPPAGEELPPPPQDIADQVVVAVWRPAEQQWKVAVAQGPHPEPNA